MRRLLLAGVLLLPLPVSAQWGTINANVNLRAGPGTEYAVLSWLTRGTHANVVGCVADRPWCEVVVGRRRGFVNVAYLGGIAQDRVPVVVFDAPIEARPRRQRDG